MVKKKKLTTKQRWIKQNKNFLISENKKLKQKIKALENGESYVETSKRPQTKEQRQKQVISALKKKGQEKNKKIAKLEIVLKEKDIALKNVLIRVAELEEIIFGKKSKKKDNDQDDENHTADNSGAEGGTNNKSNPRNKSSYRRPVPKDGEVTDHEYHRINNCPDCKTKLTKKQIITRFIEDIRIPLLDALDQENGSKKDNKPIPIKKVIKQTIEKGYCTKCRQWKSAIPPTNQKTRIGPNVRKFAAYAINVQRLTYSQTVDILLDLYNFKIAKGEITNILENISEALKPEFARLKERILQAKSIHVDETSWQTGNEDNYNWVMASGESEEAIFLIGKNRGGGNAKKLLTNSNGDLYNGFVVSDCYPVYKNLVDAEKQQKCWPHITRKSRDLANNANLPEETKPFIKNIYSDLSCLYAQIREIVKNDFSNVKRLNLVTILIF